MDIIKFDVYRGPNIGVYISVNDKTILLPMGFAKTKAEKLAKYLKVDYLFTSIANTRLIGALCIMNNKGILLPKTAYQNEYDFIKKELDLEVGVLDSKFTALGNVICANDKGAVVSPWLSKEDCQTISDVLGVETIQKKIAGFNQTGVVMVANNSGAAIHPEADEEDMKTFSNLLGVKIEQSSINNGIPYVSSGILANNNCIIVGSLTTGPEIMMLTRAFLN
ncbi:Translation initiation factor 6 protein [Marine Group I thaumarchaeote SCGC AAA799-E16]|uniref:Translation initiation factor 6 n=4 Tax=Marine Group I TaxID=905826 RepID=A0A087S785_9ARCH|nr:Translation initiation factor 6 protein [Marine Group I thaumarchaeote SCGC AAA799-E16]KFM17311.1 Translation initiation factor 6 protein [Marine Group I thaumarchaeote SCGC AAA799-D11]KFM19332.1 Translation initiation factor 6 protein [Marine Group I thaumarchaeote SCGC RSA3]KFM21589.1 Translation initiation factor 6 protein [Marine Group I thaumarchaeote SCGC AAA799-B03]